MRQHTFNMHLTMYVREPNHKLRDVFFLKECCYAVEAKYNLKQIGTKKKQAFNAIFHHGSSRYAAAACKVIIRLRSDKSIALKTQK